MLLQKGRIKTNEKTNQIILPGFKYIYPSNPSKMDPYTEYNEEIKDNVKSAAILSDIYGSDHCPVTLELDFNRGS